MNRHLGIAPLVLSLPLFLTTACSSANTDNPLAAGGPTDEVNSSQEPGVPDSEDNLPSSGTSTGGTSTGGTSTGGTGGEELVWQLANLTWYTSYPDPGSEECVVYNGCMWAGYFAGVQGQMSEDWVESHNIAAVHENDFPGLDGKTLRLRQDGREIDVTVYDKCADSDCSGCCTSNAHPESGFLIDLESYTKERFGSGYGVVEWACVDC